MTADPPVNCAEVKGTASSIAIGVAARGRLAQPYARAFCGSARLRLVRRLVGLVELSAEMLVVGLELEDEGDTGEVQPLAEESLDAAESVEVVAAVQATATRSAVGREESGLLVGTNVLRAGADQIGGDADPVDALAGRWPGVARGAGRSVATIVAGVSSQPESPPSES